MKITKEEEQKDKELYYIEVININNKRFTKFFSDRLTAVLFFSDITFFSEDFINTVLDNGDIEISEKERSLLLLCNNSDELIKRATLRDKENNTIKHFDTVSYILNNNFG